MLESDGQTNQAGWLTGSGAQSRRDPFLRNMVRNSDDPALGPSIFRALQQQLGVKLESTKGSGEVVVIDHVERPSETDSDDSPILVSARYSRVAIADLSVADSGGNRW